VLLAINALPCLLWHWRVIPLIPCAKRKRIVSNTAPSLRRRPMAPVDAMGDSTCKSDYLFIAVDGDGPVDTNDDARHQREPIMASLDVPPQVCTCRVGC
jgi:hypothetical protein